MKPDASAEVFAFRTSHGTRGSRLLGLGCIAIPAATIVAIGLVVALVAGDGDLRRGFWIAGVFALLPGLYLVLSGWWTGQVTLCDSGGVVLAGYGPGGILGRMRRFDKRSGVAVEISGGHGNYPLKLVQGDVSVGLGDEKDVFPDPYLALVAWLRERGVHVIERWEYPQRPEVPPIG